MSSVVVVIIGVLIFKSALGPEQTNMKSPSSLEMFKSTVVMLPVNTYGFYNDLFPELFF